MKLVVFGATGGTGAHVVRQALSCGHQVVAVIQDPHRLPSRAGLRTVAGGLDDPAALDEAVRGADAVISALGTNAAGPVRVCTDGAVAITAAMARTGTRRLVAVSAHGAGETHDRSLYSMALWAALRDKMLDKDAMEAVITSSDLDWTIVRPPMLTDGARTGRYRTGVDLPIRLWSRISRADLASFLIDEAGRSAFLGSFPRIAA